MMEAKKQTQRKHANCSFKHKLR